MWALLEKSFELEKLDRSFTLLPSDFVGTLIDKFLNGSLGNKSWPHGSIRVAELGAEFSFLGHEAISRCCKYRGYITTHWMDRPLSKELNAGISVTSILTFWSSFFE